MKLTDYLRQERGRAAKVAAAAGLAPAFLGQIASGLRSAPVVRCRAISAACGGEVALWDLRPTDWHLIWPELIDTPGAPSPAATPTPEVRDAA